MDFMLLQVILSFIDLFKLLLGERGMRVIGDRVGKWVHPSISYII